MFNRALLVLVSVSLLLSGQLRAQTNSFDSLVAGENTFAIDLYAQLKRAEGNLFFSPYSISTCLGMTYVGARGETARQMAKTLHYNGAPSELPSVAEDLAKELNSARKQTGIELNIANGLWAQVGHRFLPGYLGFTREQFGAGIKQADFRTQAEPVRKEINTWVSDQTKGKITDLLAPGVLNAQTRLVLVNAIYFKGKWVHPFKTNFTSIAPFTTASGEKVQARLMNIEREFKYAETDGGQLLELPYGDNKSPGALSMVVLLPKEAQGLKSFERTLNMQAISQWLADAGEQKVKVYLPKFKMTGEFGLGDTLRAMGMQDAFAPKMADFSGMDGQRDLYISAVVHKAYVDVNEEGTEAAAATGLIMQSLAVIRPLSVPVFRADHPFIFLIRDTRSGCILFMGRVNDPTK